MTDGPDRMTRTSQVRTELERLAWPTLSDELVELLAEHGRAIECGGGHVLFDVGQDSYDFVYLRRGTLDIIDRAGDHVVVTIEAPNFVGELGMLVGQGTFLAGVTSSPTEAILIEAGELRHLLAAVPALSDAVITAFAARRRLLTEWGEGGLTIVGQQREASTLRLRTFADRNRIPYSYVDRSDADAMAALTATCDLPASGVAAVTGRFEVLADPDPRQLATALGLDLDADHDDTYDLVVVGAGPGGLAAAVYGASEGLHTLIIDDTAIGGQAGTSSRIENYLGFPTGVAGGDLAFQAFIQAVKFGAKFAIPRRATSLHVTGDTACSLRLDDGAVVRARAIVLANGVQYRRLPLDRLADFEGAGVYYAATDLEARQCAGRDVVVVGGANSAGQAAMYLADRARSVQLVVRGDGLSSTMSQYLAQRVAEHPRITVSPYTEVAALHGDTRLDAITLADASDGSQQLIPTDALFIMIGAVPYTDWLGGLVQLDDRGFVVTGHRGDQFATSLPGVWAVGDVRAGSVKRVASAVGEGSVVVSNVHRWLGEAAQLRPVEPAGKL